MRKLPKKYIIKKAYNQLNGQYSTGIKQLSKKRKISVIETNALHFTFQRIPIILNRRYYSTRSSKKTFNEIIDILKYNSRPYAQPNHYKRRKFKKRLLKRLIPLRRSKSLPVFIKYLRLKLQVSKYNSAIDRLSHNLLLSKIRGFYHPKKKDVHIVNGNKLFSLTKHGLKQPKLLREAYKIFSKKFFYTKPVKVARKLNKRYSLQIYSFYFLSRNKFTLKKTFYPVISNFQWKINAFRKMRLKFRNKRTRKTRIIRSRKFSSYRSKFLKTTFSPALRTKVIKIRLSSRLKYYKGFKYFKLRLRKRIHRKIRQHRKLKPIYKLMKSRKRRILLKRYSARLLKLHSLFKQFFFQMKSRVPKKIRKYKSLFLNIKLFLHRREELQCKQGFEFDKLKEMILVKNHLSLLLSSGIPITGKLMRTRIKSLIVCYRTYLARKKAFRMRQRFLFRNFVRRRKNQPILRKRFSRTKSLQSFMKFRKKDSLKK